MTKYQLIYNGNPCFPLCDTRAEAEKFKKKSAEHYPDLNVVIKEIKPSAEEK